MPNGAYEILFTTNAPKVQREIKGLQQQVSSAIIPRVEKEIKSLHRQFGAEIVPHVDLSQLKALNAELDLKQRHLRQTIAYFKQNQIKASMELSMPALTPAALQKALPSTEIKKVAQQQAKQLHSALQAETEKTGPIEVEFKVLDPAGITAAKAQLANLIRGAKTFPRQGAELEQLTGLARRKGIALPGLEGIAKPSVAATREALVKGLEQAGDQAIAGFVKSLTAGNSTAKTAAERLGLATLKQIKNTLGIASPSREFMKIGLYAIQGLVQGIQKEGPGAVKSIQALGKLMDRAMKDAIRKVQVENTIKPPAVNRSFLELGDRLAATTMRPGYYRRAIRQAGVENLPVDITGLANERAGKPTEAMVRRIIGQKGELERALDQALKAPGQAIANGGAKAGKDFSERLADGITSGASKAIAAAKRLSAQLGGAMGGGGRRQGPSNPIGPPSLPRANLPRLSDSVLRSYNLRDKFGNVIAEIKGLYNQVNEIDALINKTPINSRRFRSLQASAGFRQGEIERAQNIGQVERLRASSRFFEEGSLTRLNKELQALQIEASQIKPDTKEWSRYQEQISRLTIQMGKLGEKAEAINARVRMGAAAPGSINQLEARLQQYRSEIHNVSATTSEYRKLNRQIQRTEQQMDRITRKPLTMGERSGAAAGAVLYGGGLAGSPLSAIGGLAGGLMGGIPGSFTGAAIGQTADQLMAATGAMANQYAEVLKLQRGLAMASVGSKDFKEAQDAIAESSKKLFIPIQQTAKFFTQLRANTVELGMSVEDTQKIFEGTALAVAATGGSMEDVEGAMRATVQILSKGGVQAEELRGQLGERFPGAVVKFAKANKMSFQELQDALQAGTVGIDQFVKFAKQNYTDYAGFAKALETAPEYAGQRMTKAMEAFSLALGEIVLGPGAQLQDTFTAIIEGFTTFLKNNKNDLREFALNFASLVGDAASLVKILGFIPIGIFKALGFVSRQIKGAQGIDTSPPTTAPFSYGGPRDNLGSGGISEESLRKLRESYDSILKRQRDVTREIDDEAFKRRIDNAKKEIDVYRARQQLDIDGADYRYRKLIDGEDGAKAEMMSALADYIRTRDEANANNQAKQRSFQVSLIEMQKEMERVRLDTWEKIQEIAKAIGKYQIDVMNEQIKAMRGNLSDTTGAQVATGSTPSLSKGGQFQGFEVTSIPGEARTYRNGTHEGYDLATPIGTPLGYSVGGRVMRANPTGGGAGGKTLEVILDNGIKGMSMHLSEVLVKVGQTFAAGQMIAKTGDTGVGAAHLHQESAPFGFKTGKAAESFAYLLLGSKRLQDSALKAFSPTATSQSGKAAAAAMQAPVGSMAMQVDGAPQAGLAQAPQMLPATFSVDTRELERQLNKSRELEASMNELSRLGDLQKTQEAFDAITKRTFPRLKLDDLRTEVATQRQVLQLTQQTGDEELSAIRAQAKARDENTRKQLYDIKTGAGLELFYQKFGAAEKDKLVKAAEQAATQALQDSAKQAELQEELVRIERDKSSLKDKTSLQDQLGLFALSVGVERETKRLQIEKNISEEMARSLATLQSQISFSQELEQIRAQQKLAVTAPGMETMIQEYVNQGRTMEEARMLAMEKVQNDRLSAMKQAFTGLGETINSTVASSIVTLASDWSNFSKSIQDTTKTLQDAFRQLATSIIQEMTRAYMAKAVGWLMNLAGMGGAFAGGNSGSNVNQFMTDTGVDTSQFSLGYQKAFKFADGGIVTGPTLGLIGEGRYNEAIIPMPNNRAVPVDLKGNVGSTYNSPISVVINNSSAGATAESQITGDQGNKLAGVLDKAVKQAILSEQRPGGLLYRQ